MGAARSELLGRAKASEPVVLTQVTKVETSQRMIPWLNPKESKELGYHIL